MDLLVISAWFPYPPSNGSKLRAYHLLKELAGVHRIHLLTFAEPGEDDPASVATLTAFCASVHVVPGNPAKAPARLGLSGLLSPTPRAYRDGYSPEMQAFVDRTASRCQVAMALELPTGLYIRDLRIPRLLEEVEVSAITEKADRAAGLMRYRHGLTNRKLARFVKSLSTTIDHMTVVSSVERERLVGMGCDPARVSVVPNGAEAADLERPLCAADRTTVVYSGSPTYGPNLDAVRWFITDTWPLVRRQIPNARFLVTGSTRGAELGTLPDTPGVEFTGFVDDVKSLIAGSGACVVPLRQGGGTRLKVLEALALGTPVVSTSKGVEGIDIMPETHALIADSADRFAAQVLRVLNEPGCSERLRVAGRALVESRYTWKRIAATLNDRLSGLVS